MSARTDLRVGLRRRLCAALAALLAAGCTGATDRPNADVVIVLDRPPNGTHAGFYVALARGYDDAEGVRFKLRRPPAQGGGAVAEVAAGRADLAVAPIEELGRARVAGTPVVGVLGLVQTPVAAFVARPGIDEVADLGGARIAAGDRALLRAGLGDVEAERVRPDADPVAQLLAGRVDALLGSWPVDGATAQLERPSTTVLRFSELGAPPHPGLVLVAREETVADAPELIRATAAALARGTAFAQVDRESAVGDLVARTDSLERATAFAQLDAVALAFTRGAPAFGALAPDELRAWSAWAAEEGVIDAPVDVTRAFVTNPL